MTEQEIKLQKFKALSFEEKQKKLLAIFEFAKDNIDFSDTAISYLNWNPDERVMEMLYEVVVQAVEISKNRIEKENKQMEIAKQNLSEKASASQQMDREAADKLLELIDF